MGYNVQIPCKGCGKLFTPCATCVNDNTAFHWRAVACSPECAKKYFAEVDKAREELKKLNDSSEVDDKSTSTKKRKSTKKKESELNRDMGV